MYGITFYNLFSDCVCFFLSDVMPAISYLLFEFLNFANLFIFPTISKHE